MDFEMNFRKVLPALLIALVLLASVLAFADEGGGDGNGEMREGAQINADNNGPGRQASPRIFEDDDDDDNESRIMEKARERIEDAREKFLKSEERYLEARQKYAEAKEKALERLQDFNVVRERLRNANASDKNVLREQLRNAAEHVLLNQINAILNHLAAIEEKQVAPEDANEVIEFFEARQAILEDGNVSREQLIEISEEIRGFWRQHRLGLQKGVALKLNARIHGLAGRAENFSGKISGIIAQLKEDGKDVSLLEEGLAKLDADLNRFNSLYEGIREDYRNAETRKDAAAVLKEGHALLKEMHRQLQKDFRLMNLLFRASRELNASGSLSDSTASALRSLIEDDSAELESAEQEFEDEVEDEDDGEDEGGDEGEGDE